jgi:arsenate reductase
MSKIAVLFLCTGNSARSQMAEAFLRRYDDDRFEAYSAGLEPKAIHPLTRQVMAEIGYELDGQYAKDVIEYMGKQHFGYLITVCAQAERNCPRTFPDVSQRLHWDIDDPAAADGSDEEKLAVFRRVRDELEARIKAWVATVASETNAPCSESSARPRPPACPA